MFKSNKTTWNTLRSKKLEEKKWYIFGWEFFVIMAFAFVAAMINQIPNWIVKPLDDGSIDPILSYPLISNIWYTSFSILFTVAASIFIGVYTEVGKFAGKYGSAIFVLVPSFVWLLSDRADDRIESIIETSIFLGKFIFWSIIALVSIFVSMLITKWILRHIMVSRRAKIKLEFYVNQINRFLLILVNILVVLMLGYSLVNYGLLSLHLSDITPEMHKEHPEWVNKTHNLHSEEFTTYIASIAIFFALLMVFIGLSNVFSSKKVKNRNFSLESMEHLHMHKPKDNQVSLESNNDTNQERGPNG